MSGELDSDLRILVYKNNNNKEKEESYKSCIKTFPKFSSNKSII